MNGTQRRCAVPRKEEPPPEILKWSARCRERFLPLHTKAAQSLRDDHIAEGGVCSLYPGYVLKRTNPVFHLVLYTIAGQGLLTTETQQRLLEAGHFVVVPAQTPFGSKPHRGNWQYVWFHMRKTDRWQHFIPGEVTIRQTMFGDSLQGAVDGYLREWNRRGPLAQRAACLYAELISVYLERELKPQEGDAPQTMQYRLYALLDRVNEELKIGWSVSSLAAELGVSVPQMHRIMLKYTGMTPLQTVTWLRMQRAQELLLTNSAPLQEIAQSLGYNNQFAFSTAFKRFTGASPRDFRERRNKKTHLTK